MLKTVKILRSRRVCKTFISCATGLKRDVLISLVTLIIVRSFLEYVVPFNMCCWIRYSIFVLLRPNFKPNEHYSNFFCPNTGYVYDFHVHLYLVSNNFRTYNISKVLGIFVLFEIMFVSPSNKLSWWILFDYARQREI